MGTEFGNCCGQLFKLFSRELHVFVSKLISQATTTYSNYKYQTETASFPFRLFLRILVKEVSLIVREKEHERKGR